MFETQVRLRVYRSTDMRSGSYHGSAAFAVSNFAMSSISSISSKRWIAKLCLSVAAFARIESALKVGAQTLAAVSE